MSESDPVFQAQDPDRLPLSAGRYWTPVKLLMAVAVTVVAFGTVVVVQWDEIERIFQAGEGETHTGQPGGPGNLGAVFDLENLQVQRSSIVSGGVGKDRIPTLTNPKTTPVADADFMFDDDRVVVVTVNGESRAYPVKVLNWHECYNDELGGVPIAVVFCPLCDSVSVVDRRMGGQTFEFGISGLLCNSNVLLYDRTDHALWSQAGLIAISGPNAGESLTHLSRWEITTFADWRGTHSDSTVATLETSYYSPEQYNRVAYGSYFQTDMIMFPVERTDDRFANKYRVVGVRVGDQARAYPVDQIEGEPGGRVEDALGGGRVVLESAPGGGVRVVEMPGGAEVLHTFWFAWYAFHPETGVYAVK